VLGDGATSKGEFYEAMNLAGAWQLPLIFVVTNNQWAISMRRAEQSAARTLAQKALAAGFTGEQVDGNDIIAVSSVIGAALANARAGGGPHLVECLTYRLADHTTSDDASRYREEAEVSQWWQQDPIARLRLHLSAQHGWAKQDELQLLQSSNAQVEAAAEAYLAISAQAPQSMFDELYAQLPEDLGPQRADMLRFAAATGAGKVDND
jgi:pyruvate dehydrogenase E1 component alpha subunit